VNASAERNTFSTTSNPSNLPSDYDTQKKKGSFGLRIVSVFFMAIPHIVTHICSGALKGLETSATSAGHFFIYHANKIGKPNSNLRSFCVYAGVVVGTMVGIVTAVPGLLLGASIPLPYARALR
jgi:hypothetical protein